MTLNKPQPVLIAGQWRSAAGTSQTFQATNPTNMQTLDPVFPISDWNDCHAALNAAQEAFSQLRQLPRPQIGSFLDTYADRIEAAKDRIVETAHRETALPISPRLADVELPRTTTQLRQAAAACRSGDWAIATIDTQAGIRSCYQALGPVCVFGPNNFPLAFGSVSGGDFAAAIAAGNPVIGKANSSHPDTTRILAEEALQAIEQSGLPPATVQLLYRTSHADGERLVSDHRVGATGYTGSRNAGLKLKTAADAAGKPIYLELSSVNPVVMLPGALQERGQAIADEFIGSALMGAGQFCTNPGIVVLVRSGEADELLQRVAQAYQSASPGTLLSPAVNQSLSSAIKILCDAGAECLCGAAPPEAGRCAQANTLLKISGDQFLSAPEVFQTEAFGNASLFVIAEDIAQVRDVLNHLEGNLTGCIYSATGSSDDAAYATLAPVLEQKVGRLLNDKMPTGVALSAAMNHGGPFPATGHPGFTAVGVPGSLVRFAKLTSFDSVRHDRLPPLLQNQNPTGTTWRRIDGQWSQQDIV